jgi:arylsulfatase A-like enzyme
VLRANTERPADLMEPTAEQDNVPPNLHQTTWCTEKALEFIGQERTGPWLLSLNPFDPHPPHNPPYAYFRRFDPETLPDPLFRESDLTHQNEYLTGVDFQSRSRRPAEIAARKVKAAYYAMIEQVDHQFGRILDGLERAGQLEDTVVIFMSDHGEALGDHGLSHKGCRFFDGLVRVPLLVSWPGRFLAGLRSDALVGLLDLAPTLLEIAGLPIPADVQGRSLLPILTGAAPANHHRDFVRCEYYDAAQMPTGSWGTMYRDRRWKLNVYHRDGAPAGAGRGELFDLEADPGEFDSLWDDPAHIGVKVALLQRSYDASMRAIDYGGRRVMRY